MKRLALAAVFLLLGQFAPAAEPFAPRDGQFRVEFPGKPKEGSASPKTAIGTLKVYTATYATADGNVFMVSYTDFPAGTAKPDTQKSLLDGVREGLKGKDGTVRTDEEIEVGAEKLPGRDLDFNKGGRRVRAKAALRNDRLFQVVVVGTPEFVEGKDAAAFLKSFEITK